MSVIQIKKDETGDLQESESQGSYSVQLSNFDIPQEMEAILKEEGGVLNIAFGYPDEEEGNWKEISRNIKVKAGNHSGKILECQMKATPDQYKENITILDNLIGAIIAESHNLKRVNQKKNYSTISKVLNHYQKNLLQEISFSG